MGLELRRRVRLACQELGYRWKAGSCLQKSGTKSIFFVFLLFFVAGYAAILLGLFSLIKSPEGNSSYLFTYTIFAVLLQIIITIYINLGTNILTSFINDSDNLKIYEKFTIYFLDCIKSINQLLTKSISDDTLYDYKKFCKIRYKFINYYDEILIYTRYLNLSPDVVKDIIGMKNEFDKFLVCKEYDYKMILCTVKLISDKLKYACFSKYGFIYEHKKISTPEA